MFTIDEKSIIATYLYDSGLDKKNIMNSMETSLPYIEDLQMKENVRFLLQKIEFISDRDFLNINFSDNLITSEGERS